MTDATNTATEPAQTSATDPEATLPLEQDSTATPDATADTSSAIAEPDSAPSRAQARIEEQAAEKLALREAAEYWRNRALAQPAAPAPVVQEKQPPKFADYDSADEWAAAHAAFVEERADARAQAAAEKRLQTDRIEATESATRTQFETRAATFKAKNPNFDAVVGNPRLPITEAMTEVIQQSERGPELAYHLGMNPDKAARISRLTPVQQAAALGRLEAELGKTPAPAPTRASTRAPAPPNPVGNSPAAKDIGSMSVDEYMAHRSRGRKVI